MAQVKKTQWKPTEKQKAFVEEYMNSGDRVSTVAQRVGITPQTAFNYFSNAKFATWVNSLRSQVAKEALPRIDRAMIEKAASGDVAAAKLIYERWDEVKERQDGRVEVVFRIDTDGNGTTAKAIKETTEFFTPDYARN